MLQPKLVPLTEEHGLSICLWRYPAPYDAYNWPSWEVMMTNQEEFSDPLIREAQYMAYTDSEETLIGFAQLFPMLGVTRLGLGLHPNYCNKGIGIAFVEPLLQIVKQRFPENEIDLEVLTWNQRAIKVYERAGFTLTDTYERPSRTTMIEVHCMVYGTK